jgi:hypothetical protein
MKQLQAKILILATVLILLSILAFIINHVIAVSSLLAKIHPLLGSVSLSILIALTCVCVFYLIGVYFLRQKPLVPPCDPTPDQEKLYFESLLKRINANKQLRDRPRWPLENPPLVAGSKSPRRQ